MIVRGAGWGGGANTIYWHNNIHKQNQKCFKIVSPAKLKISIQCKNSGTSEWDGGRGVAAPRIV